MNEQLFQIGELDVLVMGVVLPIRNLPYQKQKLIAQELIYRLEDNLVEKYPCTISFDIIKINDGCIKVKLKTTWLLIGALSASVVAYPDFRDGAKELWSDTNHVIEFMADGRMCTARFVGEKFAEGLLGPIERGATLTRIVSSIDCGNNSSEQVMLAIFKVNKSAFIDGNINLIKEGSVLVIPNKKDISKIDRNEAKEVVHLHNIKFHNKAN